MPLRKTHLRVDLRLLVEEGITHVGVPLDNFLCFMYQLFFQVLVFASQLTLHNGGVSRGRKAAAVGGSDR